MARSKSVVDVESIEKRIFLIRGRRVMLDKDLAEIYGVSTKRLNEQVRRNLKRFPEDFIIRLSFAEAQDLLASRSQNATLKKGHNIKYRPQGFTEHGVVMLASVLNSSVAVAASLHLARKLAALERKYDAQFKIVFDAIRELMAPPGAPKPRIGFKPKSK